MHWPLLHMTVAFENFCNKFRQTGDTQKSYTPIKYLKIIEIKKGKFEYQKKINIPAIQISNNKKPNFEEQHIGLHKRKQKQKIVQLNRRAKDEH